MLGVRRSGSRGGSALSRTFPLATMSASPSPFPASVSAPAAMGIYAAVPAVPTPVKAPAKSKPTNVFSDDGLFLERFQRNKMVRIVTFLQLRSLLNNRRRTTISRSRTTSSRSASSHYSPRAQVQVLIAFTLPQETRIRRPLCKYAPKESTPAHVSSQKNRRKRPAPSDSDPSRSVTPDAASAAVPAKKPKTDSAQPLSTYPTCWPSLTSLRVFLRRRVPEGGQAIFLQEPQGGQHPHRQPLPGQMNARALALKLLTSFLGLVSSSGSLSCRSVQTSFHFVYVILCCSGNPSHEN